MSIPEPVVYPPAPLDLALAPVLMPSPAHPTGLLVQCSREHRLKVAIRLASQGFRVAVGSEKLQYN